MIYRSLRMANISFPGAGFENQNNNKGVLASIGKYIAIINPDIVLHKGSLDFL